MSLNRHNPWIVVGCGRSGSSTVARILHEHFKICMGDEFVPSDEVNPEGYYEDMALHYENRKFVRGKIPFPDWYYWTQKALRLRQDKNRPWGFKIGGLPYLLGVYFTIYRRPYIIRVVRKFSLVTDSYVRKWGYGDKTARKVVIGKMKTLSRLLCDKDHLIISFTSRRKTDEEIINQIQSKWPELGTA